MRENIPKQILFRLMLYRTAFSVLSIPEILIWPKRQCIQGIHFLTACVFPMNQTHDPLALLAPCYAQHLS